MENKTQFYSIPKYLNTGKMVFGLPRDEVLPAVLIFACAFVTKHYGIGFCLGSAWFVGLRYLKVQYGENIVTYLIYWWCNPTINNLLFKHTPPSIKRYWLY